MKVPTSQDGACEHVAGRLDRRDFLLTATVLGALTSYARVAAAAETKPDAYIEALLTRMSLEEKAGQLHMETGLSPRVGIPDFSRTNPFAPATDVIAAEAVHAAQIARLKTGGIGFMSLPPDFESVELAQRVAVTQTRLKIPLLFGADIIHGYKTIFPVPIAEAASFDPDLARRTARAMAVEASAHGLDATYAPMVDVARDQRWGRVVEGGG